MALPVTVVTEKLRYYELEARERPQEEALALGQNALAARLAGYIEEGEVLSQEVSSEVKGDVLVVTLTAECEEQIGRFIDAPSAE